MHSARLADAIRNAAVLSVKGNLRVTVNKLSGQRKIGGARNTIVRMFRCNLLRRQWQAIFKRDYKAFGLGSGFYVTAALYATDHRNDSNELAPLRDDIGTASTFTSKKLDVHEISDFTEVGFDKAIKREALKGTYISCVVLYT